MARIKWRDFSGGISLTADEDMAPKNTMRKAQGIAAPVMGRLRMASPPNSIFDPQVGINVDEMIKFQNRFYVGGTTAGVKNFRRETADAPTNTWAAVTLPAAYGAQPAVVSTALKKNALLLAPPNDGKREALFFVDSANTGPNLWKITDSTTGVTTRWGILPPSQANVTGIGIVNAAQNSSYVNTIVADPLENAADWPISSGDESALSADSTVATSANPAVDGNSIKVVAGKDDVVQIIRTFGADINLTLFGATPSPDEDYIQFYVRVRRPKHIENVEIAFDTTAAADFKTNFWSRELSFQLVGKKKRKELIGLGDLIPARFKSRSKDTQQYLQDHADRLRDRSNSDLTGEQNIFVAKNTWTRVTIPKASFKASGSPNWATVRAIRFVVHANKEGKTAVFFDSLKLLGGVGMQGDYSYTITFKNSSTGTRSNPFIDQNGNIAKITTTNVERQGVTLTFPAITCDPQADQLEIWRTVGNGAAYFRIGQITLTTPGTVGVGAVVTDQTADYIGLHSGTADYVQVTGTGTFNGLGVLDGSVELPLDNDSPNDPSFAFQDCIDRIHYGRIWWARNVKATDAFGAIQDGQGAAYYSPKGRYEAVQAFVQVTSGGSDAIQKLIVWNDRLFAFTRAALYEIVGTDEPFVAQRIEGAPGTLVPFTVASSQRGLFWVAQDGVYAFNGQFAENISDKDLQTVFKWKEAVEDFSANRNYNEGTIGRNAYWLVPQGAGGGGGGGVGIVLDFETMSWRENFASSFLYWDYAGNRMLGLIASGAVVDLEPVPFNTSGSQQFSIKTSVQRVGNGQKGILRKVFVDHDPASESVRPSMIVDGVQTDLTTVTSSGRQTTEYVVNVPGERFQALYAGTSVLNNPIELFGIEFDIYVPDETVNESGIAGDR